MPKRTKMKNVNGYITEDVTNEKLKENKCIEKRKINLKRKISRNARNIIKNKEYGCKK